MSNCINIALAQFSPKVGDLKHNLEKAIDFIDLAAGQGAELVLFPELFLSGYAEPTAMQDLAETMDGESLKCLKQAASSGNVAVVGSFLEWNPTKQRIYNTAFFLDCSGNVLEHFQKIHLFGEEKDYISFGNRLATFTYRGVKYGILVCFDIEFPEVVRALALQGMQVLLVPSANMAPYGTFHHNFVLARAQENHIFVAYCNQTGSNDLCDFVGESCLVNPLGEIICQLSREEKMITGIIDLADIDRSQEAYNYLKERRFQFQTNDCCNDKD